MNLRELHNSHLLKVINYMISQQSILIFRFLARTTFRSQKLKIRPWSELMELTLWRKKSFL